MSSNDNPLFGDDPSDGPVVVAAAAGATPTLSSSSTTNPTTVGGNNNNNNLMASLLSNGGSGGGASNSGAGGGLFGDTDGGGGRLFGDDDDDDDANDPPPFATTSATTPTPTAPPASAPVPAMAPVPAAAPPPASASSTTTTTSLLMQSGLLSGATSTNHVDNNNTTTRTATGGGGLFDEVDQQQQEEQEKQQAAERLRQQQAAEAAQRQQQQAAEAARQKQQEELQRQQDLQQQEQQHQLTDQMQSVYLGNTMAPPQQQQQPPYGGMMAQSMPPYSNTNNIGHVPYGGMPSYGQQQQHQQPMVAHSMMAPAGFYRDHGAPQQQQPSSPYGPQPPHNNSNNMMGGQDANINQNNRYYQSAQTPSVLAGMHNGAQQVALGRPPMTPRLQQPAPVPTFYAAVRVSEPLLIPGQALFGNAPHWSYQIATTLQPQNNNGAAAPSGGVWLVRRRFRHVVALEERLREECPGAVLAPRPDKHATRALEEASTQQSAEFALQRCNELQVYLNQLIKHPYAYATHTLRLFLSLQDDLGTAWPECSNNTFTRLANAGVGAAVKVSEQTQATKFPWQDPLGHIDDYGEEDAELMALASAEQVRMGAVLQAVPKVEGAITLLREGAELKGSTGMELSRMAKEVETTDKELSYPVELVAGGMLRSGRRSKRMALELAAALETFIHQYKLCRYEKMAFQDRRVAIMRRNKERGKADQRAHQLMMQQQRQMYAQQQPYGNNPYGVHAMQNQAINADTMASDAVQECNEIGRRVKSEVNRISWHRRQEWKAAVKVVASANKEAVTENIAIWESVRESFLQAFPE